MNQLSGPGSSRVPRLFTTLNFITLILAIVLHPNAAHAQTFTIGATQCYSCVAGTFTDVQGADKCSTCGAGYYQVLAAFDDISTHICHLTLVLGAG